MKKILYSIVVFLIFFGGIYLIVPSFEEGRCNSLKEFKEIDFNGVVTKVFIDKSEHSFPFVYIKNSKDNSIKALNLFGDTSGFFEKIKINDKVKKIKGDNVIYKFKNNIYTAFSVVNMGCKINK